MPLPQLSSLIFLTGLGALLSFIVFLWILIQKKDQMIQELKEQKMALEAQCQEKMQARTEEFKQELEAARQRITEMINQLQTKEQELERFYKLTVDRELRMIELKKKIQEYERKHAKQKS